MFYEKMNEKVIVFSKCFCLIIFVLIAINIINLCLFSTFIAEYIMAKALPLSILAVADAIILFSLKHSSKN